MRVLGMWAEGHGDSQIEAHLRIHILTNLRPKRGVAAHLRLFAGSSQSREAPCGSRRPLRRSFLHRRFQGGEGVATEDIFKAKASR
jgi:hypothetical protein